MSLIVNAISKKVRSTVCCGWLVFHHCNQGEIVGFLGPNGAGKSTTLKMIAGYLATDAGEVYFIIGI